MPELDEARDDIVHHWKMKKAISLAREKAEAYTKQVGAEQSLRDVVTAEEYTVTETAEFTWMTSGSTPTGPGPPRISFVEGVEFPGEEFMRDVSALKAGQTGVTINYPETIVYVVHMTNVSGDQEFLRELFLIEGLKLPVLFMARQDNMRAASGWYQNLEDSLGLEWDRPPFPDSSLR